MKTLTTDLRAEAHLELVRRSITGSMAYAILLAVVGCTTPYTVDHPWVLQITVGVLAIIGTARILLARRILKYGGTQRLLGRREFRFGVMGCAVVWSGFAAFTVTQYGAHWTAMTLLLMTAGIAAGGLSSLAPELHLSRAYTLVMLIPTALAAVRLNVAEGFALTLTITIFGAFLILESGHHHRDYWKAAKDRAALRAKAIELESAKRMADEATVAKSALLANVSHEIRTPLNAILGLTEQLLETGLDAPRERSMKIVRESTEVLLTLINDILDLSKIEAGRLALERAPFNLRAAIHEAVRGLALRAHAQGLELTCRIHPKVPETLTGDVVRLRQVLTNLVGNAIKFTPVGDVSVDVALDSTAQRPEETVLHISVTDTGIGIPEDKRQAIFDAFAQADNSTTRQYGGTGLGLTISRTLVEAMGGRIWIDSVLGTGSAFHFTARFPNGVKDADLSPLPVMLRGLRVLVVDDHPIAGRIMGEILQSWGIETMVVGDGESALKRLKGAASGSPCDLVFIDAEMPGMDGFSVAEEILKDPRFPAPILMLPSLGRREAARCRALGIPAYVVKPVSESDLLEAIAVTRKASGAVEIRAADRVASAPPSVPATRKLRFLLAEDNPVNQQVAVHMLQKRGHAVTVTNNGRECLDTFTAASQSWFDVVLMDIQMPEMDGLEATAAIRDLERRRGGRITPIVAMTAHAMKGDRERCLAGGMNGYVPKPVRSAELFKVIDDVLTTEPSDVKAETVPAPEESAVPTRPLDTECLQ